MDKLILYFQYPFVRYAMIVGVLIAMCSSLLGVTLVLKRFSFIGDGLSHVAFGAMAVAAVLNFTNNMLFILPVTIVCAILLLYIGGYGDEILKGITQIAMYTKGTDYELPEGKVALRSFRGRFPAPPRRTAREIRPRCARCRRRP